MSTFVYILVAVLVFGVLIAVHELGHFLAAKACGVRVNEFSIGMGPAIFKKKKGDTLYSLRCLPFGGFCAMEGEDEASTDPAALENQGFWAKLLIFAAGAFMNFLTGLIIIFCLYVGAKAFTTPVINSFADGCPLQGVLQAGDEIAAIDGEKIYVFSDVTMLLNLNQGESHDLTIIRGGEKTELSGVAMERREYTDQSGNQYKGYGLNFTVEKATFGSRLRVSLANAADFVRMVRLSLQMLVTGQAGVKDISGPVGIVSVITDVGQSSGSTSAAVRNIAYLAAMIAVNLAVMNLLPLPALDGGKILFLVINALCMLVIRKRIPQKFESYVHVAGFALLMLLMLAVTIGAMVAKKHPILMAVIVYYGVVVLRSISFGCFLGSAAMKTFAGSLTVMDLTSLVVMAGSYFAIYYLTSRKLNLT